VWRQKHPAGHGTTGQAKFWKSELAKVLQSAPPVK